MMLIHFFFESVAGPKMNAFRIVKLTHYHAFSVDLTDESTLIFRHQISSVDLTDSDSNSGSQ